MDGLRVRSRFRNHVCLISKLQLNDTRQQSTRLAVDLHRYRARRNYVRTAALRDARAVT